MKITIEQINEIIINCTKILNICTEYKNLIKSNNCNFCYNKFCDWKPKDGNLRYNCPHFDGEEY